ncbi:outer membrane beta-barrel protein [Muricauda sp. SCSIO 64092]|uniref:outer membrane beta-barrel protein n=1 Tax=Allomuricauda sp. SCSIO 64092 TaxID=2908842 RepID=UPI001FF51752|nr:outer membrane beta-barrel protein [Muricauda sp. SCSIO 64092]UOY04867.1 outer membrane beta-barrel protein [Muricauda sp. SCSIO 64092]
MRKYIILLALSFLSLLGNSQEVSITGTIKDIDTDEKLEAATVFAQKVSDSSLISYTISNQFGDFKLTTDTQDKRIRFLVSYNGYQTIEKYMDLDGTNIDLRIIKLKPFIFELNETEVIGEIPPILVKKDTLEFNAASFRLRLDSTLEDLLRVLPGVTVEDDGSIDVNGNQVSGIKINGRSFFSSDTKIALKNLPIDIIDKVQVVDKKSVLEEFTGANAKSDEKEINVTIKKDNSKGFFGNLLAGVGDDGEYQISGIGNYFNKEQRLTVLGGSNNIDNPGFTYDDLSELSSNARNLSWRGNLKGISSSNDTGLNFSDELSSNIDITGEYFYSDVDVKNTDIVERQYFLPENSYVNESEANQDFLERSHRFDVDLKLRPDSLTQISVVPRVRIRTDNDRENVVGKSTRLNGTIINQITSDFFNEGKNEDLSSKLGLVRKFKKPGEYFAFEVFSRLNNEDIEQEISNNVDIFDENGDSNVDLTSQSVDQKIENFQFNGKMEVKDEIFKNTFLIPSIRYNYQVFETQRNVFESHNLENEFFITRLSTDFDNKFSYFLPNLGIEFNTEKMDLSLFGGVYYSKINGFESNLDFTRDSYYNDFYVDAYLSYKLSSREKFTFIYNTSVDLPNKRYFLPVPNEIDLTNIYLGNPSLDRIYRQDISINYNNYNSKSKVGFFVYGKVSLFRDDISIIRNTNDELIRTTSYTNTDGNIDGNFRVSLSKTKNFENGRIRYHLGFNSRLYRRNNFTNGLSYKIDRWSLYPTFRMSLNDGDIFDLQTSYSPRIVLTNYSPELFANTSILSHEVSLKTSLNFPKGLIFENDVVFNSRPDIGPGFESSNVFWNASLGYSFFKNKGFLKIRYFDLLNENVKNSRYTGEDYIQDSQSSVLNRYLMLSFSYRVSKSKK